MLVKDIYAGGNSSSPSSLTAVGSTLFFVANVAIPSIRADLGATASEFAKLTGPILSGEADMTIATFPTRPGRGGGMGPSLIVGGEGTGDIGAGGGTIKGFAVSLTIGVLACGILWSLWKTRNDKPEPVPVANPAE